MTETRQTNHRVRHLEGAAGDATIAGTLYLAGTAEMQPAVILVDDGPGRAESEWAELLPGLVEYGSAVLTIQSDTGSASGAEPDGDWTPRTLEGRASRALAAVDLVRKQPEIDGERVGLMGVSQGGWVAALAAAETAGSHEVAAVVSVSGAGVTVAEQERFRIGRQLPAEGFSVMETQLARSLFDRRVARLAGGHTPEAVFADERAYMSDRWFSTLAASSADELAFLARIYAFDPVPVLQRVSCPVLAMFGGDDSTVPVFDSVRRFISSLGGRDPMSQVVIVPGADHELRITHDGVPERPPIILDTIADWLGHAFGAGRPC